MTYQDCAECGGQCCKGFGVPIDYYKYMNHNGGIPLRLYTGDLDYNPRRYFELHSGITISNDGKNFIIARRISIYEKGDIIIVKSHCLMLNEKGRCMIYNKRPDICRNFNAENAEYYEVPEGCIYETKGAIL